MAKKVDGVNMNELKKLAEDLNKVLDPDPPIMTKVGTKKDDLIKAIKKASALLEERDNPTEKKGITKASEKTLIELGVKLPWAEAAEAAGEDKGKVNKEPAKKEVKGKGKETKKGSKNKERKPGVIATIQELITDKGPITKEKMLKELVKKFPDREEKSMKNTINVQVPNRMAKDKGIKINKNDKGYFVE